METRKIQQVGGGTYTVSIPVHWAEEHGIEAGTTAHLYTHRDGSLVVRWNEKERGKLAKTEIELDDTAPEHAKRLLRAAYSAGFKRIRFHNATGLTTGQNRAIDTCTRGLPGVEITDVSNHHVLVRGLLNADDVSIRQSLVQLKYVTLSMYDASLDVFAGEGVEFEHISTRDDEADRLFRLITRHFNRSLLDLTELDQLGISRPQLFEYYVTARQFERIADHAVKIARGVHETECSIPAEVVTEASAIGADARQVIKAASAAIINDGSTEMAQSALDRREQVVQKARNLDRAALDHTPEEAAHVTQVLDSIIRSANYGGNIAEVALRTSLRTESDPLS